MKKIRHLQPDDSWTLFLDRDGVINQRPLNDYVKKPEDFQWIGGVRESIAWLSKVFGQVVVVTNQQGIGKGIMTEQHLDKIHQKMLAEIHEKGGHIDHIYYCPALKEAKSFYRKPKPGMGLLAKKEFPQINFSKSVMVGDTISDMRFGKCLKMLTVYVGLDQRELILNDSLIDFSFNSLTEFSDYLKTKISDTPAI